MEKNILFIEKDWINGSIDTDFIKNPIERSIVRGKIEESRKKFIAKLEEKGFEITTDKDDSREQIYFIMNNIAITKEDVPISVYKKMFDQVMFANGGEEMHYPYTVKVEEFFAHPFFPAVFKNELANGGEDKFLIENQEQLNKIILFYNDNKENKDITNKFANCIFQQFIPTPTNHNTYLRVLTSASGDVMGATLRYSSLIQSKKQLNGFFEVVFANPNSKYYIDAENMFGYYSEGEIISFSQSKYSSVKQEILIAHSIDPNHPEVPEQVKTVCTNIMTKCNKELGIMCGFDFIYNVDDGNWYYLENQAFPAPDEWASCHGYEIPRARNAKNYVKYLEIDMIARYEALRLLIEKRNKKEESTKLSLS